MPLALIEVQTPLIPRHHSSALCVPSASLTWLCSVLCADHRGGRRRRA